MLLLISVILGRGVSLYRRIEECFCEVGLLVVLKHGA